MNRRRLLRALGLARLAGGLALVACIGDAAAFDLAFSEYATIGYAQSNSPNTYQRFIDEDGTFRRDSVAGLQVDAKLFDEFGATLQIKAAPGTRSDRRVDASVALAFVSYRPANDVLIRAGKQRIPLYLNSENYDVGATYEFARLPTEMYSLVTSNDADGLSLNKSWAVGSGELAFDAYAGKSNNDVRYSLPVAIPGGQDAGPFFVPLTFKGGGLVLTYKVDDNTFRLGAHRAIIRIKGGAPIAERFPFVQVAPGLGYYQVFPTVPGPGIPTVDSVTNTTWTAATDAALPLGLRVIGEFARSTGPRAIAAPQGNRGYLALLRKTGRWTPYVTYAFLRSPQSQRDFYTRLEGTALPPFIPGAAVVNATQRDGAAQILAYHQTSWAFGGSYAFSASSKLKAEFLRTRVADVSQLVDSPASGPVRNTHINVWSLSYSVVY